MRRIRQPLSRSRRMPAAGVLLFISILFACFSPATAEDFPAVEGPVAAERSPDLYERLAQSFDQAIETEKKDLDNVSRKLESVKSGRKEFENRISQIQLMHSTHSNLLLLPSVDIQVLEQARTRQTVAAGFIGEQVQTFEKEIEALEVRKKETTEQIGFYERQLREIRFHPPQAAVDQQIPGKLNTLLDILETKRDRIERLLELYRARLEECRNLLPKLTELSGRISEQIEARKRRRIFQRDPSPLIQMFQVDFKSGMIRALETGRWLLTHAAWQKPAVVTWGEYGVFLSLFAFFLLVVEAICYWLGRLLGRMMQRVLDADKFWQYMCIKLLQQSLPLAGAIAYLYFYPIRPVNRMTPVFALLPLLVRILAVVMAVRWGTVFLRTMGGRTEHALFHRLYLPLRRLLLGVMVYGVVYFFISRVICYGCLGLVAWRMLFEFLLLGWILYIFNIFRHEAGEPGLAGLPRFPRFKQLVMGLGCVLVLAGLVAELAGFGGLAVYWYNGLAKSGVVIFWLLILWRLLRESDVPAHIERSEDIDIEEFRGGQPYPVRWLAVRLLRVAGTAAAVFALFLAWGAPRTFPADILHAINYKVTIGDFQLSLMGFVYAVIVLLVIHTITVVIKEVLRDRVLREAEMETGLKDSIVRITGYVLWMIGVLIALRVVGISATALTVVFGALGIGLGFGLQNIFNNFLSGIILLFERPIQVGDVIEIDGIWGTVREINVRSTQVRTFDNADLIIPNSDFISQRLTNWSFRDARVRRIVQVGVAYGSDIERVRQILMEIAYQHPRILRRPHPEVLFSDFGDSALIFQLRFWVHIDWFLVVETDVRFDIDRLFKENNITIPFPQRDLHFKSDNRIPVPGAQEQET